MNAIVLVGAAALGLVALSGKGRKKAGSSSVQKVSPQATLLNPAQAMSAIKLAEPDWPGMTFDIPFGAGKSNPLWPTITNHSKKYVISYRTASGQTVGNGARRFMASRLGGRYHVGIDLYGNAGDPIVAMESGTVVNVYYFYHDTYAFIVQCDSGLVINYGEVKRNSWKEFGVGEGSRVKRGQPIARVGLLSGGSHMLHFETYMPPTKGNKRYFGGGAGPILNPTYYLLRAQYLAGGSGRAFSGDCKAVGSLNRPVPEHLKEIAREDAAAQEAPGDSVLTELLVEDQWREHDDLADGP